MKQYKRAKQKQLDLISVYEYTKNEINEQRRTPHRGNKDATPLSYQENDGEGRNHAGRSGSEDRLQAIQYQQSDARETCGKRGFFTEDCGGHKLGCGSEGPQKIGDAA